MTMMKFPFFQDPFELKPVKFRENSREMPLLVPSYSYTRTLGCICEYLLMTIKFQIKLIGVN